jgi:hypothetical protein
VELSFAVVFAFQTNKYIQNNKNRRIVIKVNFYGILFPYFSPDLKLKILTTAITVLWSW